MGQPLSIACPFCSSSDVERISAWGGQIITCQMFCRSCESYFEALRDDLETPAEPRLDHVHRTEAS